MYDVTGFIIILHHNVISVDRFCKERAGETTFFQLTARASKMPDSGDSQDRADNLLIHILHLRNCAAIDSS